MTRSLGIILFLCCSTGLVSRAQDFPSENPAGNSDSDTMKKMSAPKGSTALNIKEDDGVITIRGLCVAPPSPAAQEDFAPCETVITRHEFESLLSAANVSGQQVSPVARQNLAEAYVRYLAFDQAARKAGFEDTPEFEEIMRWARLRAVADAYRGRIVADARTATQSEVDAYYNSHLYLYDRIDVARVIIPRRNSSAPNDEQVDNRALQAAKTARDRMLRGDNPEQVQKEAYAELALSGNPPLDTETRKRSNFPREESDELFSLKSGEVSGVEIENDLYTVYKIMRNQPLEESKVEDQIVRSIAEEKVKSAIKTIADSVKPEYNLNYFHSSDQPALASQK
jgi:hypothetical protein